MSDKGSDDKGSDKGSNKGSDMCDEASDTPSSDDTHSSDGVIVTERPVKLDPNGKPYAMEISIDRKIGDLLNWETYSDMAAELVTAVLAAATPEACSEKNEVRAAAADAPAAALCFLARPTCRPQSRPHIPPSRGRMTTIRCTSPACTTRHWRSSIRSSPRGRMLPSIRTWSVLPPHITLRRSAAAATFSLSATQCDVTRRCSLTRPRRLISLDLSLSDGSGSGILCTGPPSPGCNKQ